MDIEKIQHGLSGPIASIRTPFNRDGSIDYAGLRRMVEFDIEAGTEALLITWGDSLFSILSDRDIGDITKAVVEFSAGRAVVVACTNRWLTPQAVEFASFCKEIGADILLVFLPMWYPGCLSTQTIVDHHIAIAEYIPVMTNSAELKWNGACEGFDVARLLIERASNVVAMKADVAGEFDRKMTAIVKDNWVIVAGGQKSFHMELLPYGCQGYLSTFITFMPTVTHAYWKAIKSGDTSKAGRIIDKIDRPFFDYIIGIPGGFDAAIHGIMELSGLAERWRRLPFYSINDQEMSKLSDFMKNLNDKEI